jgi:hypothetical protein
MEESRPRPDFVVESPDWGIRLVVEAKNVLASTPKWPERYLRNLLNLGPSRGATTSCSPCAIISTSGAAPTRTFKGRPISRVILPPFSLPTFVWFHTVSRS